jgi:uncharacterized membrane protein YeaQ/YmgE (transglycosylase-associated protein family)
VLDSRIESPLDLRLKDWRLRTGKTRIFQHGTTETGETQMSADSLLIILLVGLVAGWLAGLIVQGTGFGLIADICIGIVGALIGSWLFPQLGVHVGDGLVNSIVVATVGAVLLLLILRLFSRGGRW